MARTLAMFTDTSLCIGCRACQVACKQWNELPMEEPEWTGAYQNHAHFTDKTYRLVRFIEKPQAERRAAVAPDVGRLQALRPGGLPRRLPHRRHPPDRVRHRQHQPGRLQRLPVLRQLVPVRGGRLQPRHRARQQVHLLQRPHPQRARAGLRQDLPHRVHPVRLPRRAGRRRPRSASPSSRRWATSGAQLYGADSNGPLGGLNAFFLLLDKPSTYDLPEKPLLPQRNVLVDSLLSVGSALLVGVGAVVAFRERGGKGGRRCLRAPTGTC